MRSLLKRKDNRQLDEDRTSHARKLRHTMRGLQEELRRAHCELVKLRPLAATGRMTSLISHDLRNYLSAIWANLELVTDTKTSMVDGSPLVEEMGLAIRDMADMLDSLLLFAQTGQSLQPGLESLNQIVEHAVNMVRLHPSAQNVKVVIEDGPIIKSWVDGGKLRRAFYNILLNACQAANKGQAPRSVGVTLSENQNLIAVRVVDSGPGVPDSIRGSLFQPFVTNRGGIGLGLAIADCTARDHGGYVSLEGSKFGHTVFCLYISRSHSSCPGHSIS
jgi:signal transduction histidine kinase